MPHASAWLESSGRTKRSLPDAGGLQRTSTPHVLRVSANVCADQVRCVMNGRRTIVIGDIHSYAEELRRLIVQVEAAKDYWTEIRAEHRIGAGGAGPQ